MIENRESFKSRFVEVLCISKELNDASMSENMKMTDLFCLKITFKI